MNALILAALLTTTADVKLSPSDRSATLISSEPDDVEIHQASANKFGIAATSLGVVGAGLAIGGLLYINAAPKTCSQFLCINGAEGYFAIFVGAAVGVVAINLAIVAIMYAIKSHVGAKQAEAVAATDTGHIVDGDRRFDERRAVAASASRGQVVLANF